MNLLQKLVAWGRVALNWLKHFIKYVWGLIKSYWPKLKELAKELLTEYGEVILLDGRVSGGAQMLKALKDARPDEISLDDIFGLVSIAVNRDGTIGKVSEIDATTQEEDRYDVMSQQNNGILRING